MFPGLNLSISLWLKEKAIQWVITDRFNNDSDIDLIVDFNDVDLIAILMVKSCYINYFRLIEKEYYNTVC